MKAMKRLFKWVGIVLLTPIALFIIICILLYIPPVQNFLVDKATRYASEATGMQIHIGRLSLSFPLDLVVHETQVIDRQDTILDVNKLTVKIQLMPLFKKQVELDGFELKNASINTAQLMEGMLLKGKLGDCFIESHGVDLTPETAIVNTIRLKDADLSLCLADTTAADTTQTPPPFWKIRLDKVDLSNVAFALEMPLDSMDMQLRVGKASVRDGLIDLHNAAYTIGTFNLTDGQASYNSGNSPLADEGFDPAHIAVSNIQIGIDSIYYAGNDIRASIRQLELKERSGLQVLSTEGHLVSNSKTISIPSLQLKTENSYLDFQALADWSATTPGQDGSMSGRLMAEIGKNDLFKFIPGLPEEFRQRFPSSPLQIRAGVDGNLNRLELTSLSISQPEAFRMEAHGTVDLPLDSLKRQGEFTLAAHTQNMKFLQALTGDLLVPAGTSLNGLIKLKGNLLDADFKLAKDSGNVNLLARYDLAKEAYQTKLDIHELDLHAFLPKDSLFTLTASLDAEGQGFDFFSPRTSLQAGFRLVHLQYATRILSGIELDAGLKQSRAQANFKAADHLMAISAQLEVLLHPKEIEATLNTDVQRLDWQGLNLVASPFKTSQNIGIRLKTDMKEKHSIRADITGIQLITPKKTFKAKDIHLGLNTASDSIKAFANAGDLVFLFRSEDGIERLSRRLERTSRLMAEQWKQKKIDQEALKRTLPTTSFRIFSGTDNPIANFLSAQQLNYNRMKVSLETSPELGLKGDAYLYGLRTDSLSLDTIYFNTSQAEGKILFSSGVKAGTKPFQEAFDVSVEGDIGSDDAHTLITYLNGKKECGVSLGLLARIHEYGFSVHVSPENPTLVYRTFHANPHNYVNISDNGRIQANLSLFDENHTGIHFYSTPDSTVQQDLTLALNRIDIAEFRRIVPYMPDIAGLISAETHYVQNNKESLISAEVSIDRLAYNQQPMGDWALSAVYLPKETGEHRIDGYVTLNDNEIASMSGSYFSATPAQEEGSLSAQMELHHLPLQLANTFIPDRMAVLDGDLDGNMTIAGPSSKLLMNGEIALDSVTVGIPQASLNLRFDNQPVKITDSKLNFNQFKIFTQGKSPFRINGDVDFSDMANMTLDLQMNASNFEVFNAKRTKESLVYGKLNVDFNSRVKGRVDALVVRGNMNILGSSDFTYILKDSPLTVEDRLGETVTFVNFNDTTDIRKRQIPTIPLGGIDLLMTLHIDEAVQCKVDLNENGSNYMLVEGGGDLSFQYTPEGTMVLNGRYSLMSGEMKYEMPIIPLKTFHIRDGSYIEWTGNVMNPNLNIKASERVRASVAQEGQASRTVNFDVGVSITNRLENLGFLFTLEAPDDGSVQNELASMSAEERNKLAVTMLVTGMYLAEGNTAGSSGFDANSALNSFLQSEINNIAGSALKGFDVNFGMETSDQGEDGSTRTDYNFQFAKRFWNNRFRIVIGGKISTGNNVEQDESFIDNVSIEYRLDNSGTRYIKVFHDKNYESVLEGEVIETGAGIVLRKKVSRLGELFIFRNKKKNHEKAKDEDKKL